MNDSFIKNILWSKVKILSLLFETSFVVNNNAVANQPCVRNPLCTDVVHQ